MNKNNLEWLERFACSLELSDKRSNTIIGYKNDVKLFLEYIGDTNIKDVDEMHILQWLKSLEGKSGDKIKQSTKNRKIASLKKFYKYIHEKIGIIDIAKDIETKEPTDTTKKEILTKKEVDRIERLLNKNVENPPTPIGCVVANAKMLALRDRAMIMLILYTGMRVSEVLELETAQKGYNRSANKLKIFVPASKNKSKRDKHIPVMNDKVWDYINEYRNNLTFVPENNYVFLSQNGKMLDTGNTNKLIDKYVQSAGIDKHISSHCIRHTFATIEGNKDNVNLAKLANALGHKDMKMFMQTYFHDDNESDEGFEYGIM